MKTNTANLLDVSAQRMIKRLGRGCDDDWLYYWVKWLNGKNETIWFRVGEPFEMPDPMLADVYLSVNGTAEPGTIHQRALAKFDPKKPDHQLVSFSNCDIAEYDDVTLQDVLKTLDTLGAPRPSLCIASSERGIHVYWYYDQPYRITDEASRERLIAHYRNWNAFVCGEKESKDTARVLRVPGTFNHKPERAIDGKPPQVRVVLEDDVEYTFDSLEAMARPAAPAHKILMPVVTIPNDNTDIDLWEHMSNSRSGFDIARLRNGDTSGHGGDHSAADLALCNHLAFWTGGDRARMDGMFRQTGLYREKWERNDYREMTIDKAVSECGGFYTPGAYTNGNGKVHTNGNGPHHDNAFVLEETPHEDYSPSLESSLAAAVPHVEQSDDDAPDTRTEYLHEAAVDLRALDMGWVSTYASLTCRMSGSPHEFNVMGGLIAVAGAVGNNARLQMFGTVPLNLYGCIVAPSTVFRKTSSTNLIIESYKRASIAGSRLLSSRFTMEGLLAELSERPDNAGLVVKNEITSLFGAHRVQYQGELKPTITDLYDGTWLRRRLSKVTYTIERPNLSIIGSIQPGTFYEDVSAFDWQTGFIPRFLFVTPLAAPDFDQKTYSHNRDDEDTLTDLASTLGLLAVRAEQQLELAPDAFALWDTWQRAEQKRAYATDDERMMAIAGRYNTMALKLAALMAIAHDEWGPITYERMMTGILLIRHYKGNLLRLMVEQDERAVDGSKLQKVLMAISISNKRGINPTQRELCRALHEKAAVMAAALGELRRLRAIIVTQEGNAERFTAVMDKLPAAR